LRLHISCAKSQHWLTHSLATHLRKGGALRLLSNPSS
jgi:site-specific recombinase XerD